MQIIVEKAELWRALWQARVGTIPRLKSTNALCLTVSDDEIRLIASCGGASASAPISAGVEIVTVGSAVTNYKDLRRIIQRFPGPFFLASTTEELKVLWGGGGGGEVVLPVDTQQIACAELLPPPASAWVATVDGATLATGLGVYTASTDDDSRPLLMDVQMALEGCRMTMAATNAFWLSEFSAEIPAMDAHKTWLLPTRHVKKLRRVIARADGPVDLYEVDGAVVFSLASGARFAIRLSCHDREFPRYAQIFPSEFRWQAVVQRDSLFAVAKTLAHTGGRNIISIHPWVEDGSLVMGDDSDEITFRVYSYVSGEFPRFFLNGDYLLAALTWLKGAVIEISANASAASVADTNMHDAVIQLRNPDDPTMQAFIMPLYPRQRLG